MNDINWILSNFKYELIMHLKDQTNTRTEYDTKDRKTKMMKSLLKYLLLFVAHCTLTCQFVSNYQNFVLNRWNEEYEIKDPTKRITSEQTNQKSRRTMLTREPPQNDYSYLLINFCHIFEYLHHCTFDQISSWTLHYSTDCLSEIAKIKGKKTMRK